MSRKTLYVLLSLVVLIVIAYSLTYWRRATEPSTVVVGAILPLTGDVASYGVAVRQGIELAKDRINTSGGIGQRIVDVIYEDDRGEPRQGVAAAEKLISADRVRAILGAVPSSVTLAIAPIVERNRIVLLSPASSAPSITRAGDYVFRNYPSDELEGSLVARFALERGLKNAAVLTINNDYGTGLNTVFSDTYAKGGGNVVLNDRFAQGTSDFRTVLARVRGLSPAAIFIVGYGKELGSLVKQAKELGVAAQFLSTVNFHDSETLNTGGNAVEGVIFTSAIFDAGSNEPEVRAFVDGFHAKFGHGREPDVWAAHGYDALLLLAEAMRSSGIGSEDIRRGLAAIREFKGAAGVTSFDKNGDVEKPARFMTVRDGRFVNLNPGR